MHFLKQLRSLIPHWIVNIFFHLPLSIAAVIYYRYPAKNLIVIGVTGTDGKTTTSTLIYNILQKAGRKTALITSVNAKLGNKEVDTGFHVTTPDAWKLQKLLRQINDRGFSYVILESTSHGLAQYRLFGSNFYVGVITNVTHEHLDYHGNWQAYLRAKARVFLHTKFSILNKDDRSFDYLKKSASGKIITYGLGKANYTPVNFPFKTKLPGIYNQYNCLAAIAATRALMIDTPVIKEAISNFAGVIGRMELMVKEPFKVIVDFAHTPNGLENALIALKGMPHRNLIAVFGCAGLRDFSKRPLMGKIACRLADSVIITAEDPRTEDIREINKQIIFGCQNKKKIIIETDRKKAIALAIKQAGRNDIIGIFGKGHERSMCWGTKEFPWSDQEAIREIMQKGGKK